MSKQYVLKALGILPFAFGDIWHTFLFFPVIHKTALYMDAAHDTFLIPADTTFSNFTISRFEEKTSGLVNTFQSGLITAAAALSWISIVAIVVVIAV